MTLTTYFICSSATFLLVWLTAILSGWEMRYWDDDDWLKTFILSIFFPVGVIACLSSIIPIITKKIFKQ